MSREFCLSALESAIDSLSSLVSVLVICDYSILFVFFDSDVDLAFFIGSKPKSLCLFYLI